MMSALATVKRGLIAAVLGGSLQACWAVYANLSYSRDVYVTAGLVQGANSFLMSFLITVIMDVLLNGFMFLNNVVSIYLTTLVSTMSIMVFIHYSAQNLAGTPNVWLTIFPAISIGTVYCCIYLLIRLKTKYIRGASVPQD